MCCNVDICSLSHGGVEGLARNHTGCQPHYASPQSGTQTLPGPPRCPILSLWKSRKSQKLKNHKKSVF